MKPSSRKCPSCGQAVTGRSDKIYCDAACRKAAYLQAQTQEDDEPEQAVPDQARSAPAQALPPRLPGQPWPRVELRAAPAADDLEAAPSPAADATHLTAAAQAQLARYRSLVRALLAEPALRLRQVRAYQQEVASLLTDYLAQPGRGAAAQRGQLRSHCLLKLDDELRALAAQVEAASRGFFSSTLRASCPLVLGKKTRQRLQHSLVEPQSS